MTAEDWAETLRTIVQNFNGDISDPEWVLREVAGVIRQAIAEERERCAKVGEATLAAMEDDAGHPPCCDRTGQTIIKAIRAG